MFSWIPTAFAALPEGISDAGCKFATGEVSWDCIPVYISQLTFIVVSFTGSICILLFIFNAIRMIVSPIISESGNDAAKRGMLYAVIGFIVSLCAYIIVETVITTVTG